MSIHEVEVKTVLYRGDDLEIMEGVVSRTETLLLEKGAVLKKEIEQTDIYLSHPSRDFSETDEAFRIRVEDGSRVKLTYKGPKVSERSKSRYEKEVNVDVDDLDGLREIFDHLELKEVLSVIKTRKVFDLDGVEVDLDRVLGLGIFCEMELCSDDVQKAEQRILSIMEDLGWSEHERSSYLELLLEKQF